MNAFSHPAAPSRNVRHAASLPATTYIDPIDPDQPGDEVVVTTRRGLVRLALVASGTGGRFQRERVGIDPMAWLLAPRRLFRGRSAIEAALEREGCLRAVLMHGLGIGLDADPDLVDALAADDADPAASAGPAPGGQVAPAASDATAPRLFTATTVHECGTGTVHAFDAAVLPSRQAMLERISVRLGEDGAARAQVFEGLARGLPLVDAMVTDAMADMLEQVAAAPDSPLAHGLDVVLEQRFRS